MYDEYLKSYRHYSAKYGPDTAIFLMVGKFYELYDTVDPKTGATQTSMKRVVEALNIQLSVRKGDGPGKTDGLFAGVPEQSLHKYAQVLTKANWTVVVIDQVKDAKGAVVERRASRILTPGTHVEAATQDAMFVAGVWLEEAAWGSREPPAFALAAVELTTGRISTFEGTATGKADSWTADDAFHFFQVHAPRESVVWWRGAPADQPAVETLRRQFGLHRTALHVRNASRQAQGALEFPLVRQEFLQRAIPVPSLLPAQAVLGTTVATERVLCCLLQHIEEVFPSGPSRLHAPQPWTPASNLFLGNHALTQLNMVTPRLADSVLGLFQKTQTTAGRRAMRERILHPVACPARLKTRFQELAAVRDWPAATRERIEFYLRAISDLPRLHRRISTAEVTSLDLVALDQSYRALAEIAGILGPASPLAPAGRPAAIRTIQAALDRVFSAQKAAAASENAFCFQPDIAVTVQTIEAEICELQKRLHAIPDALRVWVGLPEGALRIEVRETMGPMLGGPKAAMTALANAVAAKRAGCPFSGITVHQKKSSSAADVPELVAVYRDLQAKQTELAAEVRRVLPGLCDQLTAECLADWDYVEEWIAGVDVSVTLWTTCQALGFVEPELVEEAAGASIELEGLRHPLIEALSTRAEYVKHDVALGLSNAPSDPAANTNGWLIYGMNASGKSSLMKAVGIAVLLAQAGCYVPATRCRIAPFRSLFTRILNTDNLWAGLSSFAVEMTELRDILERADSYSLVLGDEVCSGTESVSATALVGAALQWMYARSVRYLFATHLHGLLDLPAITGLESLRIWHLKVRYDAAADRLIYERTLTPGPGSSLYGLEVAKAMNLPAPLLETAHAIRRALLGTAAVTEAPMSSWNAEVVRQACEMCGTGLVKELEVHHIRPRATAGATGRFADGEHQDHVRNLIVVCAACHDKHHAGQLEIGPARQTSDGILRDSASSVSSSSPTAISSLRRSKWSDEEMETIRSYLRKYASLPPRRIVFELRDKEQITISEASLRSLRQTL